MADLIWLSSVSDYETYNASTHELKLYKARLVDLLFSGWKRKKSLPVAAAMASDSGARTELARLFSRPELSERDVARAAEVVESAGGRDATVQKEGEQLDLALTALDQSAAQHSAATELGELAQFIVEREF